MAILKNNNDIFISYSRKDFSRIKPAISLLKASGAEVFLDVEDISYGAEWEKVLEEHIKEAERIFVFWSHNAAQSQYIEREYKKAIEVATVLIIPVTLDTTPLPPDLAKYQGITELGSLLQEATQVNKKKLYLYGLSALFLALIFAGSLMFVWYTASRTRTASAPETSNTVAYPEETPSTKNTNANNNADKMEGLPPHIPTSANTNSSNANVAFPTPSPDVRNSNATASTPNPTSPITAREGEEPPEDDSFPLKYPLIVLLCIIVLIALPTAYTWFRKRKRLIKALRAQLFPKAK